MSNEPTSPTALADDNISSSTATVEDDQIFELFPRLPAEVRLKIWGIACSVPRTIPLWLQLLGSDPEFHKAISAIERALISPRVNKSMYQFATSTYTPPVLESCAKAKREGSRYYTLEFGSKIQDKINEVDLTITIPPRIYVNWEVDTLCFMPPNFDSEVVEIDAIGRLESFFVDLAKGTKINRMALGESFARELFYYIKFSSRRRLSPFVELKEIIMYWPSFDPLIPFPATVDPDSQRQSPRNVQYAQFDLIPVDNANVDLPWTASKSLEKAKEHLANEHFHLEQHSWAHFGSKPPNIALAFLRVTETRRLS